MRFETKIAIVVQENLAAWQKLNVTAFLASAVAGGVPGVIGERYEDGSGHTYLPMFRQPVLVYAADAQAMARVRRQAAGRGMTSPSISRRCSRPATTRPTGRPSWRWPPRRCPWSDWPCTGRGTPSTRSSRACPCTRDANGSRSLLRLARHQLAG